MKMIIDIPEDKYEWLKKNNPNADTNSFVGAIANGTPYEERPIRVDEVQKIIDNAPTYALTRAICGACKYADVQTNRKPCCSCRWLPRESYYEEDRQ